MRLLRAHEGEGGRTRRVGAEEVVHYEMPEVRGVGVPHEHMYTRVVGPYKMLRHLACNSG